MGDGDPRRGIVLHILDEEVGVRLPPVAGGAGVVGGPAEIPRKRVQEASLPHDVVSLPCSRLGTTRLHEARSTPGICVDGLHAVAHACLLNQTWPLSLLSQTYVGLPDGEPGLVGSML